MKEGYILNYDMIYIEEFLPTIKPECNDNSSMKSRREFEIKTNPGASITWTVCVMNFESPR